MTSAADGPAEAGTRTRVRLAARPASASAARALVREVLDDWDRAELLDEVALVATELATNAILHSGSPYFVLDLTRAGAVVRIDVRDGGATPAQAIANRGEVAASPEALEAESMTGRGLLLVASLASAWGIEDVPGGTHVWAEFVTGDGEHAPRLPHLVSDEPPLDVSDVRPIELQGCPPDLLLAHDANLADIARELRLFGASHHDEQAATAAEEIAEVVRLSAVSWDAARLMAKQGLADGKAEVDVVTVPADVAGLPRKVEILRRAVRAAEAMMARGLLITQPAPAPVQEWRDWVEAEMVGQAETGRAPVRYADWRSAQS